MNRDARHPLITGTVVTSLGTLVSRGLGLLRDMTTAALLGMSQGGVADAFWFAYRVPNLFRQLFGEGAMTASYLPVLAVQLERDPQVARQLATVVVTLLTVFLASLVALGELLFGLIWLVWGDAPGVGLLVGLSAVMLPYLLLYLHCRAIDGHALRGPALYRAGPGADHVEYRMADRGLGRGAVVCSRPGSPSLRAGRGRAAGGRGSNRGPVAHAAAPRVSFRFSLAGCP